MISKRHQKKTAPGNRMKISAPGLQGVYVQFYKFLRLGKAGYAAQAEETHCLIVGQLKPPTKMEIGNFTISDTFWPSLFALELGSVFPCWILGFNRLI